MFDPEQYSATIIEDHFACSNPVHICVHKASATQFSKFCTIVPRYIFLLCLDLSLIT